MFVVQPSSNVRGKLTVPGPNIYIQEKKESIWKQTSIFHIKLKSDIYFDVSFLPFMPNFK